MKVNYPIIKYSLNKFSCLLICCFLLLALSSSTVLADRLYVVKGPRGSITFTTRQPTNEKYSVFVPRGPTFSRFFSSRYRWIPRPVESPYDDFIKSAAEDHSLDPALVKAVVHVESSFDPKATSPKGAMGLMQLMPATAVRFGVDRPYHPFENIQGGVKYLKLLYARYAGNLRLVLAAYNAGEGAVDRIKEVPPFRETQVYVRRVMEMRELYRCATQGKKGC